MEDQNLKKTKARIQMYKDYCKELEQYEIIKEPWSNAQVSEYAMGYMLAPQYLWIDIYQDTTLCGFLIIAYDLPKFYGKGLYICEAYTRPEYREKGLMTEAVTKRLEKYSGPLYMAVFDRNTTAMTFWDNRMKARHARLVKTAPDRKIAGLTEYTYELSELPGNPANANA